MSKSQLSIVQQRDVSFYGDELAAVRTAKDEIYVSLRHLCEALGIDTTGQRQRIQRHTVLSKGLMVCKLQTIKGARDSYVLRVDLMPLWLSGIRSSSVRDEVRPKIERFQVEAARVLWEAFQTGELSADETFNELLAQGGDAVEAYKMLQGMLKLAKNQIFLQARVQNHETRIEAIEAELSSPDRLITKEQAMHISQAVKTIALELGKRSGRNEFQGVYGELYRRFQIPSYRELAASEYDEAMNFLRDWFSSLTDSAVPF